MKSQLIVASAALAAAGALGLALPAADNARHDEVALVDSTLNSDVLSLEGVSDFTGNTQPLGDVDGTSSDFYSVITSDDGGVLNTTIAAPDLLNSTDVTGANQLFGLGDTNGYLGLSPDATAGDYSFTDLEGLAFDHGVQALLTAFNQPLISYEDALGASNTLGDVSSLNLDPADLGTNVAALTLGGDLTAAYTDFMQAADLAFGLTG
jgi:hypothetical protein